jgi:hypothetical protein
LAPLVSQTLSQSPQVVQINDIVQIQISGQEDGIEGSLLFLKVVSIVIQPKYKDYYQKVLDVKDTAKDKVLQGLEKITIDELSFNQYPAYLLHSKVL